MISLFAAAAHDGNPVTIFGDGSQTRDFVFVKDVADVFVACATLPPRDTAVVMNVGTGSATSLLELLTAIESLSGAVDRSFAPERAGDVRHSRADADLLRSILGRVPATPLADGLRALLS